MEDIPETWGNPTRAENQNQRVWGGYCGTTSLLYHFTFTSSQASSLIVYHSPFSWEVPNVEMIKCCYTVHQWKICALFPPISALCGSVDVYCHRALRTLVTSWICIVIANICIISRSLHYTELTPYSDVLV